MERAVLSLQHAVAGSASRKPPHHARQALPPFRSAARGSRRTVRAASSQSDGAAGAASTAADAFPTRNPASLKWSRATVVENKEASADGSVRTLVLSVEDHVEFLEGRKIRNVQEHERWVDRYSQPGQHIAVRYAAGCRSVDDAASPADLLLSRRLFALASSPYDARRDSALLDGAIVEVVASREGDKDERELAALGPGALIEVSSVLGNGFCSLFNRGINLVSALEESRPLLMVGVGCRGMAPLRAALSWAPVLAHATTQRIALVQVAETPSSAPFLVDWDTWREAGVKVQVAYEHPEGWPDRRSMDVLLEEAIFASDGGQHGLAAAGDARQAAVLLSGVLGDHVANLTRRLTHAGVSSERILVCDYF
eukprot:scaffold5.g932.t1